MAFETMTTRDQQIDILFSGDYLTILDYQCAGTMAENGEEEPSTGFEIVVPRKGTFVRKDPNGTLVSNANSALLFHKGVPFEIVHPVAGGDRCTVFAPSERFLADLSGSYNFDPWQTKRDLNQIPLSGPQLLSHTYLTAVAGSATEPIEVEQAAYGFIDGLLSSALDCPDPDTSSYDPTSTLIRDVQIFLADRRRHKVSLEATAGKFNVSPFHLSRVFHRKVGTTLYRYLQRLRLSSTLEAISGSPISNLTEIALDNGFASHSHFSTAFKREFGAAPSEVRGQLSRRRIRELRNILKA